MVNNVPIEVVDSVKYLGVWLDRSLNCRKQASTSSARALRNFSSLRRSLDVGTRKLLVLALCYTHLDYCCSVLSKAHIRTSFTLRVSLNVYGLLLMYRLVRMCPRFVSS